ncbi:MAG: hypothetical protein IJY50_06645 [Clostridia bacterium]|nr:hypothetical protein [Clostridia bacterium]
MVTIDNNGSVTVRGADSRWVANCAPDTERTEVMPRIRDRRDHIRGI